ncbi:MULTISPECIES: DUF885 domain-containing protein [unclassified Chryseobacterium]|uniref:DUF885 domain-containing protein n=1 Tax=unclassified Chryseobacterium TaxID=2593645 RepID=UPI00100AB842|nr:MULTISPECIES: DUF885 domain-containing protein [unclassified Chryseobacterium]RXM52875.1 DUF885 domain-containing protein [Chryseobacterium sp. CH25]RXM65932.1 DUF885 domain-containing protein [Chryseobacterium sp. CH1]
MKKYRLVLLSTAIVSCMNAQQKNTQLHQIFDQYYKESNVLSPLNATFNGIDGYNDQLPADDENQLKKIHDFYINYANLLKPFENQDLNKEDRISLAILENDIQIALKTEKYHGEYMPINQMGSIPTYMALLGSGNSAQPFKTVKDYENWLKRCQAFSRWTDVSIQNMRKGIKAGIVLPKSLVVKIIPQLEKLAKNNDQSSFYEPIKNFPKDFSKEDKNRLSTEFKNVLGKNIFPSIQKLADFFQNEYLPKARSSSGINVFPNGKEMYKDYIFSMVTVDKDPEEVYKLGLSEVARITAEMEKIKTSIGFKGSLSELFEFMKTDKQFMPFKTDKEVLDAYQNVYDKIKPNLSKYFGIMPKTPFEIRKTEEFRAASASPQYFPGNLSANRPGIFYAPILDPTKINITNMDMESVFLHEAIPGHHYQISIQYENTSVPEFRQKYMNGAYVEGWALYTESLGKDLGVYTNPYHQLGALGTEMHRAIRLVVDSGLHTGKMTREEAIKYMLDNEPVSEQFATAEIERYMANPGQALSYKIGELKIKELRDKYKAQLGSKFNIKDFHDTILKGGAMPLTVFEQYMDDWAKSVK